MTRNFKVPNRVDRKAIVDRWLSITSNMNGSGHPGDAIFSIMEYNKIDHTVLFGWRVNSYLVCNESNAKLI